jgi:hypothetical protein
LSTPGHTVLAYFSVDGGVTPLADFNNIDNGGDTGMSGVIIQTFKTFLSYRFILIILLYFFNVSR